MLFRWPLCVLVSVRSSSSRDRRYTNQTCVVSSLVDDHMNRSLPPSLGIDMPRMCSACSWDTFSRTVVESYFLSGPMRSLTFNSPSVSLLGPPSTLKPTLCIPMDHYILRPLLPYLLSIIILVVVHLFRLLGCSIPKILFRLVSPRRSCCLGNTTPSRS